MYLSFLEFLEATARTADKLKGIPEIIEDKST